MLAKYSYKSDWESTIYQIKYGKFESTLKVITLNMDPKLLCNSPLSKGNFGDVFKLEVEKGKNYALKNIKVTNKSSESFDQALKEVFLAKLLSTLEVGPKFATILSYDAVLYKNSLQYAM